jgi:hypothetical protein
MALSILDQFPNMKKKALAQRRAKRKKTPRLRKAQGCKQQL